MILIPGIEIDDFRQDVGQRAVEVEQEEDDDGDDYEAVHEKNPEIGQGLRVGARGVEGVRKRGRHL